ncbi:unnamed protein product [Discosporangium mesarthrocarpum]
MTKPQVKKSREGKVSGTPRENGGDGKELWKAVVVRDSPKTQKTSTYTTKGEKNVLKKIDKYNSSKKRQRGMDLDSKEALSEDTLAVAVEAHNSYYSSLLDMIPESLVLPQGEPNESSYSHKYMKNKAGNATHQARKEESKKNKRARYAADNQKTLLEKQQDLALEPAKDNGEVTVSAMEEEVDTSMQTEQLETDGPLREKAMDVLSMDALKQRIEARIRHCQEKRTAAEGSRRANKLVKRENKKKGAKANKRGRNNSGRAGEGERGGREGLWEQGGGLQQGVGAEGGVAKVQAARERVSMGKSGSKGTNKGTAGATSGDSNTVTAHAPGRATEPEFPPLPTVEDVGDLEFSGLKLGSGQAFSKRMPKAGAPGSKMRRLHGFLAAAEEKQQRLADLRKTKEGREVAKEEGWRDAIKVAGGQDLRDNPAALKKAIKRKIKEKEKKTAKWQSRNKMIQQDIAKRQHTREENLNRRKKGGVAAAAEATPGPPAKVTLG